MSSIEKFSYSISDREFYEPLDRYKPDDAAYLPVARNLLPKQWRIIRNGIWYHCVPENPVLVSQGWKIHVSATGGTAKKVLRAVVPLLVGENTSFKFALDPGILFMITGKRWYRGGAGKFMTIYPHNQAHFKRLIEIVHQGTTGLAGQYILSDRRYKNSKCVFYRYGGIEMRASLDPRGEKIPFIVSPEGVEVRDERRPWFVVPPWEKDPFCPLDSRAPLEKRLQRGRYVIESSLRFSNSGGIYLARDTTEGTTVVIKEGRPLTNVDDYGRDAVSLLQHECRLLRLLESTGIAPRALDLFEEWEHTFLVEEYIEGQTLRQHAIVHNVTRSPLPSRSHVEQFYATFSAVFAKLTKVVQILHQHGIVFGDFSPTNVIVTDGGDVRIVDFEAACELGVDVAGRLFTPGFAAADRFLGDEAKFESDYFALGALMLSYFMPIHAVLGLEPTAYRRFITSISDDYGLPADSSSVMEELMSLDASARPTPDRVLQIVETSPIFRSPKIGDSEATCDQALRHLLERTVHYIVQSASYDRKDRLFPPDPKVFASNPLSVAYGCCGVAHALHKITETVPTAVCEWILRQPISNDQYTPSLYLGMAGVAWVLAELGYWSEAEAILAKTDTHPLLNSTAELFYGLAGWGLAQLKFFLLSGEDKFLRTALYAGEQLAKMKTETEQGCFWGPATDQKIGLAHGATGVALFLLYLYLASGESKFLALGEDAIRFDLSHAVRLGDSLLWPTNLAVGRALVPYWRYGTAGIGTVLLRYYLVTKRSDYRLLLDEVCREMDRKYTIYPGRGFGLAALGECLLDMASLGIDREGCLAKARRVASGILLFQLDKGEQGIAFPGAELWRISCDYLDGAAGIALFLHRLINCAAPDFMLDEFLPVTAVPPHVETPMRETVLI